MAVCHKCTAALEGVVIAHTDCPIISIVVEKAACVCPGRTVIGAVFQHTTVVVIPFEIFKPIRMSKMQEGIGRQGHTAVHCSIGIRSAFLLHKVIRI